MVEIKNRYTGEVICTGESLGHACASNPGLLGDADLSGANLSGAYLGRADLSGAKLAWQSHDLLSELLRRAAGDDVAKLKVAGLLLVCRDKCWKDFAEIAARDPLGEWALDTLAEWVQDGDDAPEILRERLASSAATE